MSTYYTVEQVASFIDMHPKTVRRYIQSGKINANKVGSQYRISQSELNSFIGRPAANNGSMQDDIEPITPLNHPAKVEVNTSVDIFAVDSSSAAFLTQRVLCVLNKLADVRADCIYYEPQQKLKVLLFGNIESTDQMLKHINILISQTNQQ